MFVDEPRINHVDVVDPASGDDRAKLDNRQRRGERKRFRRLRDRAQLDPLGAVEAVAVEDFKKKFSPADA